MTRATPWSDIDLPDLIGQVERYVRRRAPLEEVEDIVGTVFVKAVAAQDRAPGTDRMTPWLLAIARNAVIDHHRTSAAHRRMLTRPEVATEDAAPAPELRDDPALGSALERLSDRDRELLLLVAWEQLSHAEIAVVVGTTRANVAVRLHRARSRLRQHLDEIAEERSDPAPSATAPTTDGITTPRSATT